MQIKRALVSVFDKTGLEDFAKGLSALNIEIISSGGTAKALAKAGIKVKEVSEVTGFPEMMEGRVKTLHPKIHGGILADRSKRSHLDEAAKNGIGLIDLVVVNLYPFEQVTSKPNVPLEEAIENIDIGGPTLVRSAAKNYASVGVVVNPKRYETILAELKQSRGGLSDKTRADLALEAFEHVAHYDVVIEQYLRRAFGKTGYPEHLNLSFKKIQDMRYGENSHQTASFYADPQGIRQPNVATGKQLQGKELSFNNILDVNSAFELCKEFADPTVVIVKHNNPCGVASDHNLADAYKKALAVDSEAAFGGVVAVNRDVDGPLAKLMCERFYEVVVAPEFTKEAKEAFIAKKNLRLMEMGKMTFPIKREPHRRLRSVVGGILVQDADVELLDEKTLKVVTKRKPTDQEMKDLLYAWRIAKYVKSNAIVYARDNKTVGIGAGQMKRVDAAKLAAMIAESFGETVKGSAMASDAFFPFRDGVDEAAKRGVTCIIQPGGSIRDAEVIAAADEMGMAMIFTGMRHFRH